MYDFPCEVPVEALGNPHPLFYLFWLLLLAFVFAHVEIQIEGKQGWAAGLPTWRIRKHRLLDLFWGGRPLTGYHLWIFTFMALVFHLPAALCGLWNFRLEARITGGLMLFWIAEDFLWFVLNPAFGIRKFRRECIVWHKHWIGPVPSDYVVYTVLGALLVWGSYRW